MSNLRNLSREAIFHELSFGIRLNRRDPTAGASPGGAVVAPVGSSRFEAEQGVLEDRLVEIGARCLDSDAVLELTGGFDSRLALALALAGGVRRPRCITIDVGSGPDVGRAAAAAAALGFEHRIIAPKISADVALDDAYRYAEGSSWIWNCVAGGWLPTVYRQLQGYRTAQVGGLGGEIGGGALRSFADRYCFMPMFLRAWVSYRLQRPGPGVSWMYRKQAFRELKAATTALIEDYFSPVDWSSKSSWMERCDRYYLEQAVPGFSLPSLWAASAWYEPRAPLLSPEYRSWSFMVPPHLRSRTRQAELARRCMLKAGLQKQWEILFSAEGEVGALRKLGFLGVLGRVARRARKASPVAREYSRVLAANPEFSAGVRRLVRGDAGDTGLDPAKIEQVLGQPEDFPHYLGVLGTAAMSVGLIAPQR